MKTRTATIAILALVLAGCGSDDESGEPIPARQADSLLTQLELVQDRSDRGICGGANTQIDQLEQKVADLPRDVDADVRSALEDGLDRLRELVNDECEQNREEPETDTTETEPPPTDTQDTQPETTQPEPPPTDTQPPPTDTQPPPADTQPEPPLPGDNGGTPPAQTPGGGGAG